MPNLVNLLGIAVIVILTVTSVWMAVEGSGGYTNFTDKMMSDEEFRNNALMYELGVGFISPTYPVQILGYNVGIVLDGMTIVILLGVSIGIVKFVSMIMSGGNPLLFGLVFVVTFMLLGTLWQAFWVEKTMTSGVAIGLEQEKITEDINSPAMDENPVLFYMVIFSVVFIVWFGRGAFT